MRNINYKLSFLIVLIVSLVSSGLLFAGQSPKQDSATKQPAAATSDNAKTEAATAAVNQMIDKIIAKENALGQAMRNMHPLVETYVQSLDKDDELAFHPTGDRYFLGKLDFNPEAITQRSLLNGQSLPMSFLSRLKQVYSVKYLPEGFEQMLVVGGGFDRNSYAFEYVRREFLGTVRTLVFDVQPKKDDSGTFKGRIWVEDQDYNIVRFNGTYGPSSWTKMYFHFDSWREFVGMGQWLPAYVYTEESDMKYLVGRRHLRFKGQTRLWGYNVGKSTAQDELTALIVESDQVKDNVDESQGMSPVHA
ncbi:MAG TPA: hypothetical protein VLL56_01535, partial [Terriglobia bacterium]|nr:hypothetical protein [Terriglobia bacterium]